MIDRYSHPEMKAIWDEKNKYLTWLKVEWAACCQMAKEKNIPAKDWKVLNQRMKKLIKSGGVDPKRVHLHEKNLKHDIIAFTTTVAEKVGPTSRYIHFGLTSSDVLDTSFAVLVSQASDAIIKETENLISLLNKKAKQYINLPSIGRSHGIYAEPTSFGLKFLGWSAEWQRNLDRLKEAKEQMSYGKLSGAVGVNAHWNPLFEKKVLKTLNLKRELVSTQVVPRDRYAHYLNVLALCGGSIERMSVELRHLQRSEVGEVQEGFSKGQKGSSAMPHKKNPISSENLTGCARLLRAYAGAGMENMALWHERDISHSSVERVSFPDSTILLHYAVRRMNQVIAQLVVNKQKVKQNLDEAGTTVFSGHYLLALVKKGVTREKAYRWVQECALKSLQNGSSFVDQLSAHPQVSKKIGQKEIQKLGSIDYQLRNVKKIYDQV